MEQANSTENVESTTNEAYQDKTVDQNQEDENCVRDVDNSLVPIINNNGSSDVNVLPTESTTNPELGTKEQNI